MEDFLPGFEQILRCDDDGLDTDEDGTGLLIRAFAAAKAMAWPCSYGVWALKTLTIPPLAMFSLRVLQIFDNVNFRQRQESE